MLLSCGTAETHRYETTERLCASVSFYPAFNIYAKSRKAALDARGADCGNADQEKIREHIASFRAEEREIMERYSSKRDSSAAREENRRAIQELKYEAEDRENARRAAEQRERFDARMNRARR